MRYLNATMKLGVIRMFKLTKFQYVHEEANKRFYKVRLKQWLGKTYQDASLSKVNFDETITKKLFEWCSDPKNFLILQGDTGIGKTYFAAALINDSWYLSPHLRYFNKADLFAAIKETFHSNNSTYEIDSIKKCKHLILDDFGSSTNTDWQVHLIDDLLDYRLNHQLPTLIITNLNEGEILDSFGKRIFSRLFAFQNTHIKVDKQDIRISGAY